MRVDVLVHVSPAGVDAPVEVVALGEAAAVGGDHVRPDLVDVGRVREVHHVRGVAARRSAVDLESHVVAPAAETGLVLGETEELHVHEAACEAEALGRGAAEVPEPGVDVGMGPVGEVELLVGDNRHRGRELLLILEEGIAVGVEDRVVGGDATRGNELLEHVGLVRRDGAEKGLELLGVVDLCRAARAHAILGLGEDRIPNLASEVKGSVDGGNLRLACGGHAGCRIERLHAGLALPLRHLVDAGARRHVEVVAQTGVEREPVLIVRLDPVHLAVLVREVGDGAEDLVVVLERVNAVVLGEHVPELAGEIVVGGVAHAEHVHAVAAQCRAEVPVGLGELGGNEDKIHGGYSLPAIVSSTLGRK